MWEMVAEFESSEMNGPMKLHDLKADVEMEGLYSRGVKNGVFFMVKKTKDRRKVTYRGEFANGK